MIKIKINRIHKSSITINNIFIHYSPRDKLWMCKYRYDNQLLSMFNNKKEAVKYAKNNKEFTSPEHRMLCIG